MSEEKGLSTSLVRLRFQQEQSFNNARSLAVAVHKETEPKSSDIVACLELILLQAEVISGLCQLADGEKAS
jgi:hypothetical protein